MPPGTIHYVVSTKDSIAVGGHFYSAKNLLQTLYAMIVEHFVGHLTTNTAHSRCGILFIKMLSYITAVSRRNMAWEAAGRDMTCGYGTAWLPATDEIATLIVIISYLDQLEPSEVADTEDNAFKTIRERRREAAALGNDPSGDKALSAIYYPREKLVSYNPKSNSLSVNKEAIPEVWQITAAFHKDFKFAVEVLIPEYIEEFGTSELIEEIEEVESTLFYHCEAFYTQLEHTTQEGRTIRMSQRLQDLVQSFQSRPASPSNSSEADDDMEQTGNDDDMEQTGNDRAEGNIGSSESSPLSSPEGSDNEHDDEDEEGRKQGEDERRRLVNSPEVSDGEEEMDYDEMDVDERQMGIKRAGKGDIGNGSRKRRRV